VCYDRCESSGRIIIHLLDLEGLTLPILRDILYSWKDLMGGRIKSWKLFNIRFHLNKISAYLHLHFNEHERNDDEGGDVDVPASLQSYLESSDVSVGRVAVVEPLDENQVETNNSQTGVIVGAVIGALVAVALLVILVVVGAQMHKRKQVASASKGSDLAGAFEMGQVELK
jgi:hypothetical protein